MADFKMPITEDAFDKFLLEKSKEGYKMHFLIGSAGKGFRGEDFGNISTLLENIFKKCGGKAVLVVNGDLRYKGIFSIADVVVLAKKIGFVVATNQSDVAFCIPGSSYYPPGDDAVLFVPTVYEGDGEKKVVQWGGISSTGQPCGPLAKGLSLMNTEGLNFELLVLGGGELSKVEEEAYRVMGGGKTSILQTKNADESDSLVNPTSGFHCQCNHNPRFWHGPGNCPYNCGI